MRKKAAIIPLLLLAILVFGVYLYTSYINPSAEKPHIQRPLMMSEELTQGDRTQNTFNSQITEQHVQFIINEMGGYKLQRHPFSKEPAIIGFNIEDEQESYTIRIENNYPIVEQNEHIELVEQGENKQADSSQTDMTTDMTIHTNKETIMELLVAQDFNEAMIEKLNEGDMWIDIHADEATLALKGYKAIYDQITQEENNHLTGNVVRKENNLHRLNWP